MIKRLPLLLLTLSFFISFAAFADTNIGGILSANTTLTSAQSPYILTADMQVPRNVILTIEPGVSIKYSNTYQIYIQGSIIANGTPNQPISFNGTSNTITGPTFLKFEGSNLSFSQLSYIRMENSYKAIRVGQESEQIQKPKNTGTLQVENAEFINTEVRTAGYETTAKLVIRNSTFTSTTIIGQYALSEVIELSNCTINTSTINSESYNRGIFLYESTINNSEFILGSASNIELIKSLCKNSSFKESNTGNRLKFQDSKIYDCRINNPTSVATIERSIIKSNYNPVANFGGATITNCTFVGNGKGVTLLLNPAYYRNCNISNSSFINNQIAITQSGLNPNTNTSVITKNNFINNSIYNIENKDAKSINAAGNYWGTTNTDEINRKIFDSNDNLNYGLVNLSSPLSGPETGMSPVIEVIKVPVPGGIKLSWNANPESNLKGYKIYYGGHTNYAFATVMDAGDVVTYTLPAGNINQEIAVTAYNSLAAGADDQLMGRESWYSFAVEPVTLAPFNNICINAPAFAFSSGQPTGGVYTGIGVDASGRFNPQIAGLGEHIITYTNTDAYGSQNSASGKITVVGVNALTITTTATSICLGEKVRLQVAGSNSYTWLPANGLTNTTEPNPEVSPSATTTYTVSSLVNGCTVSANVTITVNAISNLIAGANQSVCQNAAPFSLTGFNPAGGTWSGPGVSGNGLFNPADAGPGIKTLTYTVSQNGCTFSTSKTVTVNSTPNAPDAIAGNTNLCVNQSATYNIMPVSGASSYTWQVPAGFIILSGQYTRSLTVQAGNSSGQIRVVANTNCGATQPSAINVTVNPLPVVNAGTTETLCANAPAITLSGFSPAGGTWSGPGISAAGLFSPGLAGTGVKTVTYTVNQAGCPVSASKTILVTGPPPAPYFTRGVTFTCTGKTNLVYGVSQSSNTDSYTWTVPDGFTITSGQGTNTIAVTAGTSNGVITARANSACGTSFPAYLNVTVVPPPTITFPIIKSTCLNSTPFSLTEASPVGGTYVGPGISNNMFSPADAGTGRHIIYYLYTNAAGCTSTESQTITVYNCEASLANATSVYPNPTTETDVTVSMPLAAETNIIVQLLDSQGKVVFEANYTRVSKEFRKTFNLNNNPKGMYLLKIATDKEAFSKRIILQ